MKEKAIINLIASDGWFSNFFVPWTIFLKIYPMDHFATMTPHEQIVETVLHIGQWTQGMYNHSP